MLIALILLVVISAVLCCALPPPPRCWADTMPRVVPILLGGDPATMTTAECARRAKERYLTVFALQYGGECFGCEYRKFGERSLFYSRTVVHTWMQSWASNTYTAKASV